MNVGIWALLLSYALIPNFYYRNMCKKVIKKAESEDKTIALTFDDGPDPNYTPQLLDLLKENDIKCTFFVIAEQAQKYPELIQRMKREGHYIGLHNLKHTNETLILPNKTKKQLSEAMRIMAEMGVKVKYFRPPWGMFNPFTYHYAKENNFKVILWSIHASDWSRFKTVQNIEEKLLRDVKPGDIVLLHDGRGAKGAPKRTIEALKTVLPILKERGYKFVLAKDLQGGNTYEKVS